MALQEFPDRLAIIPIGWSFAVIFCELELDPVISRIGSRVLDLTGGNLQRNRLRKGPTEMTGAR